MRRAAAGALAIAAALALASCAGPRATVAVDRGDGARLEHRMRITGYVSRDGAFHRWRGTIEPAGPDSLRLVQAGVEHGLAAAEDVRVTIVARREVSKLRGTGRSTLIAAVALASIMIVPALVWLATPGPWF
jgi:hypothetical protein